MVPVLPACRCQTYVTGSRVFPLGEWEKCLMCVSGRLSVGLSDGQVSMTISFRIKTPYPYASLPGRLARPGLLTGGAPPGS